MGLIQKIESKSKKETLENSIRKNTQKMQELISLAMLRCLKSKSMQEVIKELTNQIEELKNLNNQ